MRMNNIATTRINTFGPSPKAIESPSEQLITLTYGQLQGLIEAAIQPLQAEIAQLREEITSLEAAQDTLSDNQLIQLQLIKQLREGARREPQPTQRDRVEILHALLAVNGGKMLAKDARKKMHLSKNRFSELLRVCDFIDTKTYHLDRRQTVIILKSELVPRN